MDRVVIVEAVRTPTARYGSPRALTAHHLLDQTLGELLARAKLEAAAVDGLVTAGRGVPTALRRATLGQPRAGGRSLMHDAVEAVASGAHGLLVVAAVDAPSAALPPAAVRRAAATAAHGGLRRAELDAYVRRSRRRAEEVHEKGEFKPEIIPLSAPGPRAQTVLDADELAGADADGLLGTGEGHPGPRTDHSAHRARGAAAMALATESHALRLGLRPRARFTALARAQGDPECAATGVIEATRKVLSTGGPGTHRLDAHRPGTHRPGTPGLDAHRLDAHRLDAHRLDHYEIDETFACVPLLWQRAFAADSDRLNPRGGALALGHLGDAAALRSTVTMLGALAATGGRLGLLASGHGGATASAAVVELLPQPEPPLW
ncbi:hypothetical protein [Streptomyces daliensis]|uniref:Thiolase C-terminal domain-containing protein n=1 Tax=Streptomyces daliensis TaxID=299421 RepID=A0A8T4IRX4_9ACTN|nr:hypothetical protein [Streptomyces daliensis]